MVSVKNQFRPPTKPPPQTIYYERSQGKFTILKITQTFHIKHKQRHYLECGHTRNTLTMKATLPLCTVRQLNAIPKQNKCGITLIIAHRFVCDRI